MILWYYQIQPKVVWKVHGAWIDGYDSQNKDYVIPHPIKAANLSIVLDISQR